MKLSSGMGGVSGTGCCPASHCNASHRAPRLEQENAREAAAFAARENFTSLRLVTANYHMRRALLEFRRAMPDIEIVAQPPGTKLKGISLLSGGQRTMTAVALLFAIYMVKPSPLCVLDELDAPLDDANVGRFTDIIREFTRFSQFVVITHNKRTVSAADAIFGATMQEKGVTRLFSMRFNKERDEAEPTSPGSGFTMAR
jgi:ABC-type lipoprotein export system ATPase subunit